jgi:hypothetical protein
MTLITEAEVRSAARSLHVGHRDNPIEVIAPGDLDRAVRRNWDPSPGQAAAGNYQMTHAILGSWDRGMDTRYPGLEVTIETPLDRMRSGTAPDGTPWSVRMPAHYGYVKRTEGADGDHVDVYVGPEAHRIHTCPVYVIDQVDADDGGFDEHKCMLGFSDGAQAGRTYIAAFSDGRGVERIGSVRRMDFDGFVDWLRTGDTKSPVGKSSVVSALGCACTPTHSCGTCKTGGSGEFMTIAQTAVTPRGAGYLIKAFGTLLGRMTPAERVDMIKEASLEASMELGKATTLLEEGDDHDRIRQVEDLFDGPPDDRLETTRAGGPESSVPAGKVGVGKPQDASGHGAEPMEREYSRPTRQSGVQAVTEDLGRKLMTQARAMKSLVAFGQAMQSRVQALETQPSPTALTFDPAVLKAEIAKALPAAVASALAKAIPEVVRAVSKAKKAGESESTADKESESGEDDEGEDADEDDEAEQTEGGSGTDIEIVNELDEEDDAESESDDDQKKAMKKAAALERLLAKGLVKLAKVAAMESEDAMEDGRHAAGRRHHKKASRRMAKARSHAAIAKSLRGGRVGPSMTKIEKSLGTVAKALKETKAKNQDKWPSHGESVGNAAPDGGTVVVQPSPASQADLAKIASALEKSLSGYALMQADVQQVMRMVGGQSRNPQDGGRPPVTELFKSSVDLAAAPEAQMNALASSGQISMAERDKGIDALASIRMALPDTAVKSAIANCAPPVQEILRRAA